MRITKSGNISLMILTTGFILLIIMLIVIIVTYIQVTVQIYDIKSNIFYVAQSSIRGKNMDKMAYNDYTLDKSDIKENINLLLKNNYMKNTNKKGIVNIYCYDVNVIYSSENSLVHTKGKYDKPILCIRLKVIFRPIISMVKKEAEIMLHDDIKISLLEFK